MNRRRQQSGTTLVELLVSIAIIGIALSLMVGTFGSAVLIAARAKTVAEQQAIYQYEIDKIGATVWDPSNPAIPGGYSDCFTVENAPSPVLPTTTPTPTCASGTMRADVVVVCAPSSCGLPSTLEEFGIVVVDGTAAPASVTQGDCTASSRAVCVYKDER